MGNYPGSMGKYLGPWVQALLAQRDMTRIVSHTASVVSHTWASFFKTYFWSAVL